jgi:hypothetical protein
MTVQRTFIAAALPVILLSTSCCSGLNLAPFFTADMNQHTLEENTPVGSVVYRLQGEDPEGSPVTFGIEGSKKLTVNSETGEVTVAEGIDRESSLRDLDNEIRLTVTIQDRVREGEGNPNVVRVPISVIVLDENDNEPVFRGTPYKSSLNEDSPVGTTIFRAIEATDRDLIGEVLEVKCVRREGYTDLCDFFDIVPRRRETDHDMFRGSVVLKKALDYRERQIYQIPIAVYDGVHTVESDITFTINDVQNSPPVFTGSLTGIVNEDDAIGTPVLKVKAKDGDTGNPRRIIYDLVANPNGYFVIDVNSGMITVDRALDREHLSASSGVLSLTVRASELVNGVPGDDDITSSTADITITIRDVNDEAPTFNQQEYDVTIPENVPFGTPLANLNMEVKDTDTGANALFKIDLLDNTDKFSVEPATANGHTAVSIKVNSQKLDYENPNERKFLLLVVATETNTEKKLSSTATVTVQIQDLNDNSPAFDKESYTAIVSESATQGTDVITVNARDRDSGDYGTEGIRYKLMGTGSNLFNVDPISGKITVAACDRTAQQCLDYETTRAYFLSYSATDNNGEGKRTVVNLRITVADANDNPPLFAKMNYVATIDEGQVQFQPRLILKAIDKDDSSVLEYTILDGNINNLFHLDQATGEVIVAAAKGLRLDNIPTDQIRMNVQVTDSKTTDFASVEIDVKDVNDREPIFEKKGYLSSVPENAEVGTPVENVMARDADFGKNAEIVYRIQKGAYNDFEIDPETGFVVISNKLNYDRRDKYTLELVAVDKGVPSLSGTATLTVNVMNKNDKVPYFLPTTQRTHITEDTLVGSLVIQLNATDADVSDDNLEYSIIEPVTAVDHDGKPVSGNNAGFRNFFGVNASTGQVFVTEPLDRNVAAIVTMPVRITDQSAVPPQHGHGSLVVTIVDINDFAPRFQDPWSPDGPYITINVAEEQPNGTFVYKFIASDADSNIDYFKIAPKNQYFGIERGTGNIYVKSRIDFESMEQKRITFDLHVFDAGVPQKSASAFVIANIENLNDEVPQFEQKIYKASVPENSASYTIIQVKATDLDEGEFGRVHYRLSGTHKDAFSINPDDGTIAVVDPSVLDREAVQFIILQVVAADSAQLGFQRSTTVPVNITILDENDNPPRFIQRDYSVTIVDNIPYYPEPSPITQLTAVDDDVGINAKLHYSIVSGNEENQFFINPEQGIIYPNASFVGQTGKQYDLTVEVADEGGVGAVWPDPDRARVIVDIENVNTHKPEWFPEPPPDQTIEINEESSTATDFVILKVNARDRDVGENQRISYFIKLNNKNEQRTEKFGINEVTGELRAIGRFDREEKERYELILVARDHGTPIAFETLRFVTVVIKDINDNGPKFPDGISGENMVRFTVPEEEDPGYFVGRVKAEDPDSGTNGRVYYYIIGGNEAHYFSIDKIYGNIYTKKRIDREQIDQFDIQVKAGNNPDYVCEGSMCDLEMTESDLQDQSVVKVQIFVEDKNDNLPRFRNDEYFVGIPFDAKVGDLILNAEAFDPDLDNSGALVYSLRSSNLYRSGETTSSGSLVPSPFEMRDNGRLVLGSLMAEFNQDRFIIDIEAKEPDTHHRAKASINLWIYEPEQLIKLVIDKSPMEVNKQKDEIVAELHNVTQDIIVIDEIKFHVSEKNGQNREMTDMYVHAVREETNEILMPEEVLKVVDANYDHLSIYYESAGIHSILPAAEVKTNTRKLDANLIALIGLIVVIFFGAIMFSILCCCMKSWVAKASTSSSSNKPYRLKESVAPPIYNPASVMEEAVSPISPTPVGGTDNPLWIDQKYKAYEEQELTMTVFSDQDNSVISGSNALNGGSVSRASHHLDSQSNAYATINKLPMVPASRRSLGLNGGGEDDSTHQHLIASPYERDYATLEKSVRSPPGPLVPGIHSTPVHQESLPRRRFSNDFTSSLGHANGYRGSNIVINKNGEPELVADLM